MQIKPGYGIDQLLFGMTQKDVIALYGTPSRTYSDEDDNAVLLYNDRKLRLTFYAEEEFRLGYMISALRKVSIGETSPIGLPASEAVSQLKANGFARWTSETFDTYENFVNEDQWIILQSEFGEIVKVELGAFIDGKSDAFIWRNK